MRINAPQKALEDYLTADYGWDLRVWSDGSHDLEQSNTWAESEVKRGEYDLTVRARVKCPGIGQQDTSFYTEDFVALDEDRGAYVVNGRSEEGHHGKAKHQRH